MNPLDIELPPCSITFDHLLHYRPVVVPSSSSTFCLDDTQRQLLDEEKARLLLQPLLDAEPGSISYIQLSGKSFGEDAAKVAGAAIAKHARFLRALNLADVIAGRPEDEALKALNTMAKMIVEDAHALQGLDLLDLSDNALGAKGVEALQPLLERAAASGLQHLVFNNNGLAADAAKLITSIFINPTTTTTSLKSIHFFNNLMESASAPFLSSLIQASPNLQNLRCSSLRIGREGAEKLAASIADLKQLQILDFSDNTFALDGAQIIAQSFTKGACLQALTVLNLKDTSLEDDGVNAIMKSILKYHNSTKKKLPKINNNHNNNNNNNDDDDENSTASDDHHRTTLIIQELDLAANEITADAISAIAKVIILLQHSLRVLNLEENEITSKGCSKLAKYISKNQHLHPVADAKPTWALTHLNLASNEIGNKGAQALLTTLLPLLGNIQKLDLNTNQFKDATVEALQDQFETVLESLDDNDPNADDDQDEDEDDDDDDDDDTDNDEEDEEEKSKDNDQVDALAKEIEQNLSVQS